MVAGQQPREADKAKVCRCKTPSDGLLGVLSLGACFPCAPLLATRMVTPHLGIAAYAAAYRPFGPRVRCMYNGSTNGVNIDGTHSHERTRQHGCGQQRRAP